MSTTLGSTLNPKASESSIINSAVFEGTLNATLTLIPSLLLTKHLMTKPGFVMRTNVSSRTAITIMPAFFVWCLSTELGVITKRRDDGNINALKGRYKMEPGQAKVGEQVNKLYKAVFTDNVRVVPRLSVFNSLSNFLHDHPFRVIAGLGAPLVAGLFYTQQGKDHLKLSQKVMHTRVYAQFSVLCVLLSLMGWKSHMDSAGRYITEDEAVEMVEEEQLRKREMMEYLNSQQERNELLRVQMKKNKASATLK